MVQERHALRLLLLALGADVGRHTGQGTGGGHGIRGVLRPLMGTGLRVLGLDGAFRLGVHVHVRGGTYRGKLETLGVLNGAAIVDHGGNVHPVAAGVELGLAAGVVVVKGDVKEAFGGVGGPDAADPAVGDGGVVLDVDGVGGELVRQGQDLIGVVGGVGGVIGPIGGQGAGGDPQFVQVDGAGRFYVELVRRGLGEAAGAHQVAVDEIVQLPAGEGDAHGHPLVAVAIVGKISNNFSGRCKSVLPIQIMSAL